MQSAWSTHRTVRGYVNCNLLGVKTRWTVSSRRNRQTMLIDLALEVCAGGVATASAVRPAQRDRVMLLRFAVGFGLPHYH